MPLDPDLTGRDFPATPAYGVSRRHIAAFAAAVGESAPVHHDVEAARAAGHADVVAPVTFPIVIAFGAMQALLDDPEVGIDLRHVIHADQRFESVRPVRAGDSLTARLTVESQRSMGGSDIIATRTELTGPEGELVCTAYARLAHTAPDPT